MNAPTRSFPTGAGVELHGRAGEAIAASLGASADNEAEILSLHFFHAQSYRRAWHYARIAGRRAREKYANVDAATHFESALSAGRRIPDLPQHGVGIGMGVPGRCT